jgi:peptide/nickel transport system permease protein
VAQVSDPSQLDPQLNEAMLTGQPEAIVGRTPWDLFWRRFRQDHWAIAGGIFVVIMVLLAFAAPLVAKAVGHPVEKMYIYEMLDENGIANGPTLHAPLGAGAFVFGADDSGRDLFVRVLYGARTSLTVAFLATILELIIGVGLGLAAGFYRGKIDTFVSRSADVVYSLPVLLLALGLVSACGLNKDGCFGGLIKPGIPLVSFVIGFFSWPYIMRIVRGQVLSIREKEFVEASRSMGAGNGRIMVREILPSLVAPIIVYTTLIIPTNILFEAALSFLGIGVPPTTPSWGAMLDAASTRFTFMWWYMLFPGFFLFATTLAFNLLGDGLRDAFDPRMSSS